MSIAIYPGSFDPVTNGHLDVIKRTSSSFDKIIVAVLTNSSKTPLFTVDERIEILTEVTKDIPNVEIEYFSGLTVDFAKKHDANVIIRGLRAITDFDYELQMASTNKVLAPNIDTMFLATCLEYAYISSSMVKEVAKLGGDISKFVTPYTESKIAEKWDENWQHFVNA